MTNEPQNPTPKSVPSIEEQYQDFKQRVFPGQHSRRVEAQIRSAFYAGAGCVVISAMEGNADEVRQLFTDVVKAVGELAGISAEPPVDPTQN